MSAIPPRDDRVLQAADHLKGEIACGRISGFLPGERALAKRLRVSRVTLQKALRQLETEKWVTPAKPRCRRETLRQGGKRGAESSGCRGKTIVTLAPLKMAEMPATVRLDHARVAASCADAGVSLIHGVLDTSHLKRPAHRLKEFVRKNPADLYLLLLTTKEVQKWFSQTGTPCIVLGTAWPHCHLSSADWDQQALGVHAGAMLKRLGHERVGMVYPEPSKHGIELFVDAFRRTSPGIQLTLARQDDAPDSILKALRSLVAHPEKRPTVIILPRVFYVLVAVSALPAMGLRIPEEVSLLCLVHDESFRYFHPNVAAYRVLAHAYPAAIFNLAVKKLRHADSKVVEDALVMPDFVEAPSLGPAPSAKD